MCRFRSQPTSGYMTLTIAVEVIYGKLTVHDRQTDRQTKFTLRSLERGSLTLAPIKETSQLAGKGYKDSDYTLVIAIVQ